MGRHMRPHERIEGSQAPTRHQCQRAAQTILQPYQHMANAILQYHRISSRHMRRQRAVDIEEQRPVIARGWRRSIAFVLAHGPNLEGLT